jgi:hypothetical protein
MILLRIFCFSSGIVKTKDKNTNNHKFTSCFARVRNLKRRGSRVRVSQIRKLKGIFGPKREEVTGG